MRSTFVKIFIGFLVISLESTVLAQNIPVSFPMLNDYLRREQVMGNLDSDFSFNYRPILVEKAFPNQPGPFLLDSAAGYEKSNLHFQSEDQKLKITPLPIQLTSVFNSHRPFGWGNGPILPARGIQTLVSAGAHLRYRVLSVQLYPQFHYAQNRPFEEYPTDAPNRYFTTLRQEVRGVDAPIRHGRGSITKLFPGNSHILVNFGSFAAGVSTENIWWGPGQSNALLISDNAPGFLHATVKTTKPAKTFLGNFEGQYFAAKLDGSNLPHFSDGHFQDILANHDNDNFRYFTGFSLSYAPKWIPNLSVGVSRTFQVYREDMQPNFRAWFPLLDPLQKEVLGNVENNESRQDQHVGGFLRWYFPAIQFEFYGEYIRDDHALNWRDAILNPEHARGYTLGLTKYFKLPELGQAIEVQLEMIQTQNSVNRGIRQRGAIDLGYSIYFNSAVSHGLTQRGQILGSGLGLSGNLQKLQVSKVEGFNRYGIQLLRISSEEHFLYFGQGRDVPLKPNVNFGAGVSAQHQMDNFLISGILNGIVSTNKNWWNPGSTNLQYFNSNRYSGNLNIELKVAYFL